MGLIPTVSIVMLYYYRLNAILDGSIYKISNTQSNILKIGFVVFAFFAVSCILTFIFVKERSVAATLTSLAMLTHLFLLIYLIITLRKQLTLLINRGNASATDCESIWHLMKRFTILAIVSCCISAFVPIVVLFSTIVSTYQGGNNQVISIISNIGWMLMYHGDILCIILQFGCYDTMYNLLCSKCQKPSFCTKHGSTTTHKSKISNS